MIELNRIEPPSWYCGMNDPILQIMLCGKGIREARVTTTYPGAVIEQHVRLDSPNYLFLYINIKGVQPGVMPLVITLGRTTTTIDYSLHKREKGGEERYGFTNADVLYLLMPDRFAQGRNDNSNLPTRFSYSINRRRPSMRHGGDLEGIRQHLDYFTDLGVTALWLTPVLENDQKEQYGQSCYHGYATTDYYRVDPRFGTNDDYRRLVDEAHAKGLKVVMDMIFNHCGDQHPWMHDTPSADWFNKPNYGLQTSYKLTPVVDPYASKVDLEESVDGWFVRSMPDLNQRNPHLMRYLVQNSIWWIETIGIDGIRMDTYPYADANAMSQWMKVINDEYPHFNVVGESWVTEPGFTAALQAGSGYQLNTLTHGIVTPSLATEGSHLTTVMDFALFDRLGKAKYEETDEWWNGFNRIYNTFVYDYLYPNPRNVLAFLDNHDTNRYLCKSKDIAMLKQGLALLLTINRIPQLYYGTEILMNGVTDTTDGNVRRDFPGGFPGDRRSAFTSDGRTRAQNAMYEWLRKLLHWRKGNKTITEGRQIQFIPWRGIYVVAHKGDSSTVLTIINGTSGNATFSSHRYVELIPSHTIAREVTSGRRYDITHNFTMKARETLVLEFMNN